MVIRSYSILNKCTCTFCFNCLILCCNFVPDVYNFLQIKVLCYQSLLSVYDPTMVVPLLSIYGTGNIPLVVYCDDLTMLYLACNTLRTISKQLLSYLTIAAILTMYFVEMCGGPEAVNPGHTEHQLCHMLSAFIINEKQNHRYFI